MIMASWIVLVPPDLPCVVPCMHLAACRAGSAGWPRHSRRLPGSGGKYLDIKLSVQQPNDEISRRQAINPGAAGEDTGQDLPGVVF
jgi:hypothetical protein